jgi:hypothetical protein
MLVKDEADIIESTIRHLAINVGHIYVADNLSTDGTTEILERLSALLPVTVLNDPEVGYRQSAKTSYLAGIAYEAGYDWVVPCDADEIWYSPFGRLSAVLDGLPPDALFATGIILNHVGTGDDDGEDPNPVTRMKWRIEEFGKLPKVACRTSPQLVIGMGNHDAKTTGRVSSYGQTTIDGQIYIHHYPWRSPAQFERKIANGARAYAAAPEIGPEFGNHWRAFGMPEDEGFQSRTDDWYRTWGFREAPWAKHDGGKLVLDPAPANGQVSSRE